ncbi:hypothetical protein GCM10010102_37120 [Promicromonospora citrea]|uniref:Uncharacterized protein n=1 Tax=Promicromonospora citrea TaxID=43677 RepID=A0A8H9GLJ6_9MICO|nr:hypothetical protein [Promicromonospora citrea]GGM38152.1 hypothetical protein GCM10010102_37120 [Promicromonospora citrea]
MTAQTTARTRVVAQAWRELGAGVAPLSNAAGLPLARTVKLILDPLVVRPARHPHLGRALLDDAAARELRARLLDARDHLVATAAWFVHLKRERRARGITEGHPQDLYFQRAYELAHRHGAPGPDAAALAGKEVADVHDAGRVTAADLRAYLTLPDVAADVRRAVDAAWAAADDAPPGSPGREQPTERPTERLTRLLDSCATDGRAALDRVVAAGDGAASGAALRSPGRARTAGLSAHETVRPPEVGARASKSALPPPFDRSILERLFGTVAALELDGAAGLRELVTAEAGRSAQPWQLATEPGRAVLAAGAAAARLDGTTDAARRLAARWEREAFVRRALRLPDGTAPTDGVREAFLRRLWARVHGRELRGRDLAADAVWDLLDGAMRSVVLDRRDQVKAALARDGAA